MVVEGVCGGCGNNQGEEETSTAPVWQLGGGERQLWAMEKISVTLLRIGENCMLYAHAVCAMLCCPTCHLKIYQYHT